MCFGLLIYESDGNSTRECVTKDKCHGTGYELRIQCLTKKQCEARGYYQIDEETYMCVQASIREEGQYYYYGSCVSREECTLQQRDN